MTSHVFRLAALLLLGVGAACGDSNRARDASCDGSDVCAPGLTCANGTCRAPCNTGTDCPVGNGCSGGLCMPLATGTCGQSADCKTPPDACHTASSPRCVLGRCEYGRANTSACDEACTTAASCTEAEPCEDPSTARCVNTGCVYSGRPDGSTCQRNGSAGVCFSGACVDCVQNADCDPRNFGRDLCSAGTCVNRVCSFTPIEPCDLDPLGASCGDDDSCRSGYCANGRCCDSRCDGVCIACAASGHCDQAKTDDARCGTIDCDGLDTVCRDYRDYNDNTGQRCVAPGVCRQANSADCAAFVNASPTVACRGVNEVCDVVEHCLGGVCPADALAEPGDVCNENPDPAADRGRCDGTSPACRELVSFDPALRYFIEESAYTLDRDDFFGHLDLEASGSNTVSSGQLATGRYVQWPSTASNYRYCGLLGDGELNVVVQVATIEAVVSIADANLMADSTIFAIGPIGPSQDRLELTARRVSGDAAGRVTFAGTFGRNTAEWTVTLSGRTVVHLLVDGRNAVANDSLNLYVDGGFVPRTVTGTPSEPSLIIDLDALDVACVGNDFGSDGAFTGRLYYAAMYFGVFDATEVGDAAVRLTLSDAP